jgi:hypothetical protein
MNALKPPVPDILRNRSHRGTLWFSYFLSFYPSRLGRTDIITLSYPACAKTQHHTLATSLNEPEPQSLIIPFQVICQLLLHRRGRNFEIDKTIHVKVRSVTTKAGIKDRTLFHRR